MPAFQNGTNTLKAEQPVTLDPDDAEAEQRRRMGVEAATADAIEKTLRQWLRDVLPKSSDVDLAEIERKLESGALQMRDVLRRSLQQSADLGVQVAVEQLDTIGYGFDYTMANRAAAEWVDRYTFDLVRGITETTRDRTRTAIREWINNGDPLSELRKELTPIYGRQRAELIVSTEVTRGYAEGQNIAYRDSGVVEKTEWRTA